jgi:hypothetical protein
MLNQSCEHFASMVFSYPGDKLVQAISYSENLFSNSVKGVVRL